MLQNKIGFKRDTCSGKKFLWGIGIFLNLPFIKWCKESFLWDKNIPQNKIKERYKNEPNLKRSAEFLYYSLTLA